MVFHFHSLWVNRSVFPAETAIDIAYSTVPLFLCYLSQVPVESFFFRDLMKLQNCFTEARLLFLMNFLYAFLVAFLTLFLMWWKFSQSSLLPLFLALLYALCLRFYQCFIYLVIQYPWCKITLSHNCWRNVCVLGWFQPVSKFDPQFIYSGVWQLFSLKALLIPSTSAFSSVVSALL